MDPTGEGGGGGVLPLHPPSSTSTPIKSVPGVPSNSARRSGRKSRGQQKQDGDIFLNGSTPTRTVYLSTCRSSKSSKKSSTDTKSPRVARKGSSSSSSSAKSRQVGGGGGGSSNHATTGSGSNALITSLKTETTAGGVVGEKEGGGGNVEGGNNTTPSAVHHTPTTPAGIASITSNTTITSSSTTTANSGEDSSTTTSSKGKTTGFTTKASGSKSQWTGSSHSINTSNPQYEYDPKTTGSLSRSEEVNISLYDQGPYDRSYETLPQLNESTTSERVAQDERRRSGEQQQLGRAISGLYSTEHIGSTANNRHSSPSVNGYIISGDIEEDLPLGNGSYSVNHYSPGIDHIDSSSATGGISSVETNMKETITVLSEPDSPTAFNATDEALAGTSEMSVSPNGSVTITSTQSEGVSSVTSTPINSMQKNKKASRPKKPRVGASGSFQIRSASSSLPRTDTPKSPAASDENFKASLVDTLKRNGHGGESTDRSITTITTTTTTVTKQGGSASGSKSSTRAARGSGSDQDVGTPSAGPLSSEGRKPSRSESTASNVSTSKKSTEITKRESTRSTGSSVGDPGRPPSGKSGRLSRTSSTSDPPTPRSSAAMTTVVPPSSSTSAKRSESTKSTTSIKASSIERLAEPKRRLSVDKRERLGSADSSGSGGRRGSSSESPSIARKSSITKKSEGSPLLSRSNSKDGSQRSSTAAGEKPTAKAPSRTASSVSHRSTSEQVVSNRASRSSSSVSATAIAASVEPTTESTSTTTMTKTDSTRSTASRIGGFAAPTSASTAKRSDSTNSKPSRPTSRSSSGATRGKFSIKAASTGSGTATASPPGSVFDINVEPDPKPSSSTSTMEKAKRTPSAASHRKVTEALSRHSSRGSEVTTTTSTTEVKMRDTKASERKGDRTSSMIKAETKHKDLSKNLFSELTNKTQVVDRSSGDMGVREPGVGAEATVSAGSTVTTNVTPVTTETVTVETITVTTESRSDGEDRTLLEKKGSKRDSLILDLKNGRKEENDVENEITQPKVTSPYRSGHYTRGPDRPLSPSLEDAKNTVTYGTVGNLVKGKFKDLNLTARIMDPSSSLERSKSPPPAGKKYKWGVEGIDYPASDNNAESGVDQFGTMSSTISSEQYGTLNSDRYDTLNSDRFGTITSTSTAISSMDGEIQSATSTLQRTTGTDDSESQLSPTSTLEKTNKPKRGFTYLLDESHAQEVTRKATAVKARAPHVQADKAHEHRVSTLEKEKDQKVILDARANLAKTPASPPTSPPPTAQASFSDVLKGIKQRNGKANRSESMNRKGRKGGKKESSAITKKESDAGIVLISNKPTGDHVAPDAVAQGRHRVGKVGTKAKSHHHHQPGDTNVTSRLNERSTTSTTTSTTSKVTNEKVATVEASPAGVQPESATTSQSNTLHRSTAESASTSSGNMAARVTLGVSQRNGSDNISSQLSPDSAYQSDSTLTSPGVSSMKAEMMRLHNNAMSNVQDGVAVHRVLEEETRGDGYLRKSTQQDMNHQMSTISPDGLISTSKTSHFTTSSSSKTVTTNSGGAASAGDSEPFLVTTSKRSETLTKLGGDGDVNNNKTSEGASAVNTNFRERFKPADVEDRPVTPVIKSDRRDRSARGSVSSTDGGRRTPSGRKPRHRTGVEVAREKDNLEILTQPTQPYVPGQLQQEQEQVTTSRIEHSSHVPQAEREALYSLETPLKKDLGPSSEPPQSQSTPTPPSHFNSHHHQPHHQRDVTQIADDFTTEERGKRGRRVAADDNRTSGRAQVTSQTTTETFSNIVGAEGADVVYYSNNQAGASGGISETEESLLQASYLPISEDGGVHLTLSGDYPHVTTADYSLDNTDNGLERAIQQPVDMIMRENTSNKENLLGGTTSTTTQQSHRLLQQFTSSTTTTGGGPGGGAGGLHGSERHPLGLQSSLSETHRSITTSGGGQGNLNNQNRVIPLSPLSVDINSGGVNHHHQQQYIGSGNHNDSFEMATHPASITSPSVKHATTMYEMSELADNRYGGRHHNHQQQQYDGFYDGPGNYNSLPHSNSYSGGGSRFQLGSTGGQFPPAYPGHDQHTTLSSQQSYRSVHDSSAEAGFDTVSRSFRHIPGSSAPKYPRTAMQQEPEIMGRSARVSGYQGRHGGGGMGGRHMESSYVSRTYVEDGDHYGDPMMYGDGDSVQSEPVYGGARSMRRSEKILSNRRPARRHASSATTSGSGSSGLPSPGRPHNRTAGERYADYQMHNSVTGIGNNGYHSLPPASIRSARSTSALHQNTSLNTTSGDMGITPELRDAQKMKDPFGNEYHISVKLNQHATLPRGGSSAAGGHTSILHDDIITSNNQFEMRHANSTMSLPDMSYGNHTSRAYHHDDTAGHTVLQHRNHGSSYMLDEGYGGSPTRTVTQVELDSAEGRQQFEDRLSWYRARRAQQELQQNDSANFTATRVAVRAGDTGPSFSPSQNASVQHQQDGSLSMNLGQSMTMDYVPPPQPQTFTETMTVRAEKPQTTSIFIQEDRPQQNHHTYQNHEVHEEELVEEDIPQVVRGSILIKNTIDTTGAPKVVDVVADDDEDEQWMVEENTNMFHSKYMQNRENPMYNSDEDLSRLARKPAFTRIFRRDEEDFTEIPVDYTGHKKGRGSKTTTTTTTTTSSKKAAKGRDYYVNGRDQTDLSSMEIHERTMRTKGAPPVRDVRKSTEMEIARLIRNAPADSVKQRINVEREEEEIMGPLPANHADGSEGDPAGMLNFDTISEKVDVGLSDGVAQLAVKVRCERIVPIRGVDDLFKKSSVIVTRLIEIDLGVTEDRRRLYDNVMRGGSGAQLMLEEEGGGGRYTNRKGERKLGTKETFKLYKMFMGIAEAEEGRTHDKLTIEQRLEDEKHLPDGADFEFDTEGIHKDGFDFDDNLGFDTDELDNQLESKIHRSSKNRTYSDVRLEAMPSGRGHLMKNPEPDTISYISQASEQSDLLY